MFWLWRMCLKFILQNVNVPAATMAILTFFVANHDYFIFFSMIWLWRMCLKSNFANCECPSAYVGDPPDFMNKYGLKKCKRIVC